jgi:hypothetical protein
VTPVPEERRDGFREPVAGIPEGGSCVSGVGIHSHGEES